MSRSSLAIQAISGHAGTTPGAGTQRGERVAKLIDTTTCIGCKACEVACLKAGATGCLHFGSKEDMTALGQARAAQLREHGGHARAGLYDPEGVGGASVMYVLHDATNPEAYGGLPKNPRVPLSVKLWKGP